MKKLNKILLYILLGIIIASCKKEHLQPNGSTGSPVFYFNGNVNSAPVSLQGGINNYYMYSSYTQDANNVYNYTGALQQIGCTTCSNSIKIIINDYKTTATNASETNMNLALTTANYEYLSPTGGVPTGYMITFNPTIGSGSPVTYNYKFGDGGTYSGSIGTQTHTFTHPGSYITSLSVNFTSGMDSIQNQPVIGSLAPTWITTLSTTANDSLNLKVSFKDTITAGGTAPFTVLWNFGDGKTVTRTGVTMLTHDTITHVYPANGVYQVSVKYTDANNYTHTDVRKNISTDTLSYVPGSYVKSLAYTIDSTISNPDALSNITIIYTDASGDVYSSANVAQPSTSYFKILSVTNYQNNENNQATKQLHVQFNCLLKDGSGNKLPITNGDAVIAVAYK